MPLNSKLLKFRNLNIKTYLNNILAQFEKSILISDLNFIEKIRKEVDTEIFKSFLLNSDSLLEVLYTYESVKNNLNNLEDIKNDFKLQKNNKNDKNIYLNTNLIKLEEFKTVLNNFTSEVQSYDTGSRILIHFDIFLDENDNKNIFLLTNDILIIGKIDSRTRKYQLVNAYSYLIVDIKIEDGVCGEGIGEEECGGEGDEGRYREDGEGMDREGRDNEGHGQSEDHYGQCGDGDSTQIHNTSLPSSNSYFYLVLSKSFTKFKGNKKNIYKFYSIFKDLNYNFEDLNEKDKKNKKKNELIEFLIETEQYEEIEKFRKNDNYEDYNFNYHLFLTKSDLDKNLNLFKNNPLNFLFDFLLKRFKSVLENVNKVMPLKDLIDLLFDEIFMKFRKEQEEIFKNCNVNVNYLLLLEKEIIEIFKLIENRNINNDLMKDKLLFDQYDFTYLTDYFTKKKKYYQEEKFNEAKKEIDVLLSEMVK